QRRLVEREELLVSRVGTVRLVVRRGRQAAGADLRQVVARAPEVRRERPLQVLVAVERAAVEDLDVDGDAGRLRLLREDLSTLVHADRAVRGLEVDVQAVLPRRLEERLRLLDVLVPLRQRRV